MVWEKFESASAKDSIPKLSIRKNGQIGLNTSCIASYQLDGYTSVILFVDKEAKKIGIKFYKTEEAGAKKIRYHEAGGATIPAKNFTYIYQLPTDKRVNCFWDKTQEMLIAAYE